MSLGPAFFSAIHRVCYANSHTFLEDIGGGMPPREEDSHAPRHELASVPVAERADQQAIV